MKILIAMIVLSATAARADSEADAKAHYAVGADLYTAGDYAGALVEFRAARQAKALPALDFNIGRCLDNLGRKKEALAAYKQYAAVAEALDVDMRIRTLEREIAADEEREVKLLVIPQARQRRKPLASIGLGVAGLTLGIVGAGLLGSAASDYSHLASACAPLCHPEAWSVLPGREHAGEAMLGIGAGVALTGVVVYFALERRR